ncbi:hypothetical protein IU474_18435 [Nocardia otitidiscaviarum]|uniref:hypothetical protein n=1 Tax=Nocardia otitidiscaviarum TaxID=1823 RepID=UPI0018939C8C|nr:hypothetical protein [Nocardia otitidiscaviarum]MBF6239031.1 hypothetical protein [Nocardia otitidiscaviarum]
MTSELSQPNQHPGQHPPQPEQPWNSAAASEDQAARPHSAVPSLSTGQPQAAAPQTLDARSPADAQPPADTPPRAEANPQAEAKPYPGVTPYPALPAHQSAAPPPYPAAYQPYPDAAVTPPGPPRPVRNAYYLMLAGAVLTVLSTLIGFLQLPSLREEMAETTEGVFTRSELDTLVAVSFGVGVVLSLISAGLWVWMAFANRAGKNWARVTATVLFGLYTASMLFALIGIFMQEARATVVSTMFSVVLWCVGLAAVILLWNKQSTAYFRPAPAGYAPSAGPAGMPYPGQPGGSYPGQPANSYPGQSGAPYPGQPGALHSGQPGAPYPGQPGAPYAGSGTPPTAGGPYPGPPGA